MEVRRLIDATRVGTLATLLFACTVIARPVAALTFTVTSTGDGADADLDDDLCATAAGPCTLRAALEQANATMGQDTVAFAIPPLDGTVKRIAPGGPLPTLADPAGTTIDGFTQNGAAPNSAPAGMNAVLRIELDGGGAGDVDGLIVSGGNSTVRGLVINRFARNGIGIVNAGSNRIEGNFIGTDVTGLIDRGNAIGVLILQTGGNVIGGNTAAARNLIAGNNTGVSIDRGSGNTVAGNFIGLAADGQADLGNDAYGVLVFDATQNTIGGAAAADRNVISGNDLIGVVLLGAASTGNAVQGNFIGTNAAGLVAVANQIGISIEGPANTIGGLAATPGAPPGNVIGGNTLGIRIPVAAATGTVVQGNLIGTDVTGTAALTANPSDGIEVHSAGNTIGGAVPAARNVISGHDTGVRLEASGNIVQGNRIGTDITGTLALGNDRVGVDVRGSNTMIGGVAPAPGEPPGNLISGNGLIGVFLGAGSGNTVQGNAIGVQADGTSPLANGSHGISIGSGGTDNTIGGAAGAGNTIAFNDGHGVLAAFDPSSHDHRVEGNAIFSNTFTGVIVQLGRNVAITRNAIFANGQLGINLVGGELSGEVTRNDAGDADVGSNDLQNFPALAAALPSGAGAAVTGMLASAATTRYTIEFFASDACDPSGFGEGQTFLAALEVTTDASGVAPIDVLLDDVTPGRFITATATDPNGNTSEFSACPVVGVPTPTITTTVAVTATATPTSTPTTATQTPTETRTPTVSRTPTGGTVTPTSSPPASPTSTPTATVAPSATPTRGPCPGDCDNDHVVEIAELVLSVNIGLGLASIDECPLIDGNLDRRATITELIIAVKAALNGCP
jgi:titin